MQPITLQFHSPAQIFISALHLHLRPMLSISDSFYWSMSTNLARPHFWRHMAPPDFAKLLPSNVSTVYSSERK